MKHSIQYRFTVMLLSVVAATLIAIYAINTFGLESFYVNQKVRAISMAYKSIDSILRYDNGMFADQKNEDKTGEDETLQEKVQGDGTQEGGLQEDGSQEDVTGDKSTEDEDSSVILDKNKVEKLSEVLKEYSDRYNISIALIDSLDDAAIISSERDGDLILRRAQDSMFAKKNNGKVQKLYASDNYSITRHDMASEKSSFIECIGYCSDNRTLIVMSSPMESVRSSVDLSNTFLMYIALTAFILSIIMAFFMTKRVTRPILTLANISEKICKLDFTARYEGKYEDEIGVLGNNINLMSEKLKSTIADLKSANESLREDIKRKEEIDEMRKSFIANVSHELKTPIALIQGYAEGLNEGMCEDKESRKYYTDVIIDEANRMNSMVKQLLSLSVLESGSMELRKEIFDIYEMVSGVVESNKILVSDKNIEFILEGRPGNLINADEFKLEEVVTNYISNAIKHVSDNGKIIIRLISGESTVKLEVYNTGNAIPQEDLEHIWDKFYKVDKAHSRDYGGTGIGLSIVKAILEIHDMTYGVENIDEGVMFWFEANTVEQDEFDTKK